jgi:opacity protein-like surface antigen
MKSHLTTCLLTLLLTPVLATAGTEPSSDKAPPAVVPTTSPSAGWFRIAPYAWLPAVEGDVAFGRLTAPIDISLSDSLDTLDMAYMGVIEAGYGKWSLGMDVVYAKNSEDFAAGGRLFDSFRFELKQAQLTPFVSYRAIETDRYRMDLIAGARVTLVDSELTGRYVRGGQTSAGLNNDYADPIIGIRGQAELTDMLFFRYSGDIGGFGVESELVWQAFLGLGCHLSNNVSAAIGYRGMGMDYEQGAFSLDTVSHGPVIGLEVRF